MASISNLEKAYKFSVRDMTPLEIANDPQLDLGPLVIEHDFRTITIPSGRQLLGVTSDENVNIVPFVCPRYYGPTDLSEYDFRVNYENANGEGDAYAVQDLEVHDDDTLTFTWTVGRHACEYAGNVHFIVCARIADSGGIISNEYNTAVHTLPVVQGLETDAQIAEDNYDLIEEFLQNLDAAAAIPQQAEDVAENTLKVEGMTYGTQDGEPVDSGSEYYHNNSVYYNTLVAGAGANALKAEGFAVGEQEGVPVASGSDYYHNNAEYYAGEASDSATLAASKASEVADKVLVSDTEPSASGNLVWVKSTPGTVQIPTYAEFSDVKSAFDTLKVETTIPVSEWVQGYIRNTNGTVGSDSTYCASGFVLGDGKLWDITIANGYACAKVAEYTAANTNNFTSIVHSSFTGSSTLQTANGRYYRLQVGKYPTASTSPSDISSSTVVITEANYTDVTLSTSGKAADAKATGDEIHKNYSGRNVLVQSTLTLNKYINTSGTVGSSEDYAVTDYIAVNVGDVVIASYGSGARTTLRYVTAYNSTKTVISASGADTVQSYTVPSGVSYIRISANKTRLTNTFASIILDYVADSTVYYEPHFDGETIAFGRTNKTDISNILRYPLTILPSYILGAMAYKPLGELSKGYICLVSDDGDADLATYTIPMLITKEVPATFAVMRSSECWTDDTNKATVIDAVTNHGCEIAQHGGTTWDQYDELTLDAFFNNEKAFWDTLGLTPYGAVCPAHNINNLIRVVAGGRFGCVRTGYDDGLPSYTGYTNGPRSNMFGLCSQSALDGTLETQKATLDACLSNHWLRILHWHENEMDASDKTQLEGIIDYAKTIGLTFVTMKDIPWIT